MGSTHHSAATVMPIMMRATTAAKCRGPHPLHIGEGPQVDQWRERGSIRGAEDEWGEVLLDDEVVADTPSGASGKGGAPVPVIKNEPADVAKATARCDRTLQSLYSGKLKVKNTLSRATIMGGARPVWARSWTVPRPPPRPLYPVWRG